MKTKLLLAVLITFLSSAQVKAGGPLSSKEYFAMGVQNGYNLIYNGKVSPNQNSTYQNSLNLAIENHNMDYYDGLVTGANKAWQALAGPVVVQPEKTYVTIVHYYYTVTTYTFNFSDGSKWIITVSPNIQ